VNSWLDHLQNNELDCSLSLREFAERVDSIDEPRFGEFELRWRQRIGQQENARVEIAKLMNSVNPLFIPRNHRVAQAIEQAIEQVATGDLTVFEELNTVLSQPYSEQPTLLHYAEAPEPSERVTHTFCGT